MGLLLQELGAEAKGAKCYASKKGSELQVHVSDVMEALRRLQADPACEGWEAWAIGKDEEMQRRANRLGITPTKAWLARAADAGLGSSSGETTGDKMPAPHEKQTAQTRLAQAVADGASLEEPDTFKTNKHYNINADVEDIYRRWDQQVSAEELPVYEQIVRGLAAAKVTSERELQRVINEHRRELHMTPKKSKLLHVYHVLVSEGSLAADAKLQKCLVKKSGKSESGVLVITVLTSPYPTFTDPSTGERITQSFSCEWDCYYCPNEPDQPRSYLHDEPSVLRANQNSFDPVLQFTDRAATLAMNGHPVDKIELLVLGGTWSSYPTAYQEEFVRDLFYAANTFYQRQKRPRMSLAEEQRRNETETCKIIGLTLETRPDTITVEELRRFRRYGCTRVQLGVQHTADKILKKINRGCKSADTVRAIALLKDSCYKIDIHLMPNLPGSNVESDLAMFDHVLYDHTMQVDQWKIYPCETVPWTVIKQWYESGKYVPYPEPELFELLMDVKTRVHPWIRLNRVIRDIPSQYILGGHNAPNMRQDLAAELIRRGGKCCSCIRCREVGADPHRAVERAILTERRYEGSGAPEIFLSFETPDEAQTLCGFLRLRLPNCSVAVPTGASDDTTASCIYTPLRKSTECSARLKAGTLRYNPPSRSATGDSSSRVSASDTSMSAGPVAEGAIVAQQRVRAKERKAAVTAAGDENEVVCAFPELQGCALIRELHVYGKLVVADATSLGPSDTETEASEELEQDQEDAASPQHAVNAGGNRKNDTQSQHGGFGRRLMARAEEIAIEAVRLTLCKIIRIVNPGSRGLIYVRVGITQGYTKLAVISGVGVRNYYRRLGYELRGEGEFLIKDLPQHRNDSAQASEDSPELVESESKPAEDSLTEPLAAQRLSGGAGVCVAMVALALGVHTALELGRR